MKLKIRIQPILLVSLLILTNCDRFPRDNPIDPANTNGGEAEIVLLDEEQLLIDDAIEYGVRNNGNGVIEPGETIRFVAELMNVGDENATGVEAALSFTDPCVLSVRSARGNRAYYGDIEPGHKTPSSELAGSVYYEVVFSSSSTACSDGYSVTLLLEVEDETDRSWDFPLEFEITESDLRIDIADVFINDTFPNEACNIDNAYFEIGETVQMDIRIRNNGSSLARSVQARLLWDTSGCIRFPSGEERNSEWLSYGDMRPESSKEANDSMAFIVETRIDECSVGNLDLENLDLELEIKDASARFSEQPLKLLVEGVTLRESDIILSGSVGSVDDNPDYDFEANDGDRNADPGETIHIDVEFENEGNELVRLIRFELDEDPERPCISRWNTLNYNQESLEVDELNPRERSPKWELVVVLSETDCESGELVDLTFMATDDCGRTWPVKVPLLIE